jgi:hypothetical protein
MDTLGPHLLFRVRTIGFKLFHRFGLYVSSHLFLFYTALIRTVNRMTIKALRDSSNSRYPYLRSRHHLSLLPCSRYLFVLTATFPRPLLLSDPRSFSCCRRHL